MRSDFRNKLTIFAIVFIIIVLVAIIFRNQENKPFENVFQRATAPFARFFSATGAWTNDRISFFSSIGELKKENERFYEENIQLKAQLAKLQDVKNENEELRKQIELAPYDSYELEAAMLIGKDMSGRTEIVYIDKGADDGVKSSMAIVVGESVMIGKVLNVHKKTSQVELLTSKNAKVNAEIVETGAKGIVRGQYGTSVMMDMIPQTVEVNKGDTVITSGVGSVLPRGLLIGYAQEPVATPDQLFQQSSLVLPAQAETARMVWIVMGTK